MVARLMAAENGDEEPAAEEDGEGEKADAAAKRTADPEEALEDDDVE